MVWLIWCTNSLKSKKWMFQGKAYWKGRLSTVDLLELSSLDQLLLRLKILLTFIYKTSCLNEVVKRTEPSPSVNVPWMFMNAEAIFLVMCDTSMNELWATYTHRDLCIDLSRLLTAVSWEGHTRLKIWSLYTQPDSIIAFMKIERVLKDCKTKF
jgi:hypothetical protein